MDLQQYERMQHHLRQTHETAKFQLIMTELGLASIYCQMAASANEQPKAERNVENARRAYVAAMHFLESAALTIEMRSQVHKKLRELKPMLLKLEGARSIL